MEYTIIATAPKNLAVIKAGEIYEASLFSNQMMATLRAIWVIQQGTIADEGTHKSTKVIRFVRQHNA